MRVFRDFLSAGLLLVVSWPLALPAGEVPIRIAVLDAMLVHGSVQQPVTPAEEQRLQWFTEELREALDRSDRYELVDHAGLSGLRETHAGGRRLNTCGRCQAAIGRGLGAEQVILPLAFKMSELVVTLGAEIRDADDGAVIGPEKVRIVRIAGNTDESWRRGRIAVHQALNIASPEPVSGSPSK